MSKIMVGDTPEMRSAAFREASNRKAQMEKLGIVSGMNQDEVDAIVIKLSEDKASKTGTSASKVADGQEWYVNELIAFAEMNAEERYIWGKTQALPAVGSDDELLEALA